MTELILISAAVQFGVAVSMVGLLRRREPVLAAASVTVAAGLAWGLRVALDFPPAEWIAIPDRLAAGEAGFLASLIPFASVLSVTAGLIAVILVALVVARFTDHRRRRWVKVFRTHRGIVMAANLVAVVSAALVDSPLLSEVSATAVAVTGVVMWTAMAAVRPRKDWRTATRPGVAARSATPAASGSLVVDGKVRLAIQQAAPDHSSSARRASRI